MNFPLRRKDDFSLREDVREVKSRWFKIAIGGLDCAPKVRISFDLHLMLLRDDQVDIIGQSSSQSFLERRIQQKSSGSEYNNWSTVREMLIKRLSDTESRIHG